MGTNYYLKQNVCPHCKRGDESLHIGKSSCGWHFSLHVIPELGINDLPDWEKLWRDGVIIDEDGNIVTPEEMLKVVKDRGREKHDNCYYGYKSRKEFYRLNHCQDGLNNLVRHTLGNGCVKHGEGTWDCIVGDFS